MLRKSGALLAASKTLSHSAVWWGRGLIRLLELRPDGQVDLLNVREAPCALLNAMRTSGPVRRYFPTFCPRTRE
jgi:hypothetical protein